MTSPGRQHRQRSTHRDPTEAATHGGSGTRLQYLAIAGLARFQYALEDHEMDLEWTRPPAASRVFSSISSRRGLEQVLHIRSPYLGEDIKS